MKMCNLMARLAALKIHVSQAHGSLTPVAGALFGCSLGTHGYQICVICLTHWPAGYPESWRKNRDWDRWPLGRKTSLQLGPWGLAAPRVPPPGSPVAFDFPR